MKSSIVSMLMFLSVFSVSMADITVGIVKYTECSDTLEYTYNAIYDILNEYPDVDVVIAGDEALTGNQNRGRIIFGRDTDDAIIFQQPDTHFISAQVCSTLADICTLADEFDAYIIPGTVWEVDSSYRVFCSAPIIGPEGNILRVRRKAHQERTDTLIDECIRLDTIYTHDGNAYSFFVTISNESRDIPEIYEAGERADIWFCLETHWFNNVGHAADEFESVYYPDYYVVNLSFQEEYYSQLNSLWFNENIPAFFAEMSYFSGAFWMQNLYPDELPPNQWFRMDLYDDTMESGIVARCNPYSPSLFTKIENNSNLPEKFVVNVSPNPFNSSCEITIPENADVEIYDLRGNVVTPRSADKSASLVPLDKGDRNRASAKVSGGSASAQRVYIWIPDETVASGVYLVRARMEDGQTMTKRVMYLR